MFKLISIIISILISCVGGYYIGGAVDSVPLAMALAVVFGICCGSAGVLIGDELESRYGA